MHTSRAWRPLSASSGRGTRRAPTAARRAGSRRRATLPRLAGEALLAEAAATGARRIAFDAVAARLEATAAPPPPLGTALAAWPTGWGIEEATGNFCGLAHWAVEVWHAAGSVDASRWQVKADGGRLFFVRVAEKAA
mmetsp:Transcript_721/g.2134  ORF Transcript_721/g.2134 Transcript_721/m.2134 type:complete len:137 (-) Transcript_721:198-608(-)